MPRRDVALLAVFAFCVLANGMALDLGWAAAHPCKDTFEGGCGYGKAIAGFLSWLCACGGFASGVVLAMVAMEARRRRVAIAAWALAIVPGLYVVYGVVMLAAALLRP